VISAIVLLGMIISLTDVFFPGTNEYSSKTSLKLGRAKMTNLTLIEQLTWAIVEVSRADGKPDLARISEVLSVALGHSIVAREQEKKLQQTLLRTAAVMDQPLNQ